MKSRLVAGLAIALLASLAVPNALLAQGSGSSDASGSGAGSSGESTAPRPARVRQKFTMKLPDEYRSRDTDRDNQIGMYEWPKSDWAGFRKLDLNGDGFLTPQELNRKGRGRRSDSTFASSSGSFSSSSRSEPRSTGDSASSSESSDPPTALPSGEVEKQADRFFQIVDKDKNGKITEEEVKGSSLVRPKFEKAGINPSYPLNREEFIRLYVQASSGGSK